MELVPGVAGLCTLGDIVQFVLNCVAQLIGCIAVGCLLKKRKVHVFRLGVIGVNKGVLLLGWEICISIIAWCRQVECASTFLIEDAFEFFFSWFNQLGSISSYSQKRFRAWQRTPFIKYVKFYQNTVKRLLWELAFWNQRSIVFLESDDKFWTSCFAKLINVLTVDFRC